MLNTMQAYADLLERLMLTPSADGKRGHLVAFFRDVPSPDRGYALAVLTGMIEAPRIKTADIRVMIEARMDAELFRLSYKNGGDLSETIALVWPASRGANRAVPVEDFVAALTEAQPEDRVEILAGVLNCLDATGRWAALKLVTGGIDVGVSPQLARAALADYGGVEVSQLDEMWHGLTPPYADLFDWLEGNGARPTPGHSAPFRTMAPVPELCDAAPISPDTHAAFFAANGQRVLLVCQGGARRLYTIDGGEITHLFPDVLPGVSFKGAVDGVLTVRGEAPGEALNKRLANKRVSKAMMAANPADVTVYDVLAFRGEDMRARPFRERFALLNEMLHDVEDSRLVCPVETVFRDTATLNSARNALSPPGMSGLYLKRWCDTYGEIGGWTIWRRDPLTARAALLYVERGSGRHSNRIAAGTFGVWGMLDGAATLLPVGKATLALDGAAQDALNAYVKAHTNERFGPVRSITVTPEMGLVFDLEFEAIARAPRRKSGIVMRGLRVRALRSDLTPESTTRLETLEALLPDA